MHQIGIDIAAEKYNKISLPMTRVTLSANLGLEQRTPASSVQIDKGLENQRVRTSASSNEFISSQMGFRNESCVKIGSEKVVAGVFAPGCHVALEGAHHTFGNLKFAFRSSVFASSSVRVMS